MANTLFRDKTYGYEGSYRLLTKIADGGMGTVYLAEQLGADGFTKTVGIKTIRKKWATDPRFRNLFIGEARLVADLIHENIQQVYQLIEMENTLAIVMEWVNGVTFEDINSRLDDRNDYLPPDLAVFLVSRVARALAYAHEKRDRNGQRLHLVHRDVNPVNIFVNWQGVVKLADFGIAKARTHSHIEEESERVGKTPYMAPEQARGEPTDNRSDIFSLGLALFEMLTGEQLHPVAGLDELIIRHRELPLPSVRTWNPTIPERVDAILHKMLAFAPYERYQSARDVVRELELYMYSGGYGPTNEKLAAYLHLLFPDVDKHRIIVEEVISPPPMDPK